MFVHSSNVGNLAEQVLYTFSTYMRVTDSMPRSLCLTRRKIMRAFDSLCSYLEPPPPSCLPVSSYLTYASYRLSTSNVTSRGIIGYGDDQTKSIDCLWNPYPSISLTESLYPHHTHSSSAHCDLATRPHALSQLELRSRLAYRASMSYQRL